MVAMNVAANDESADTVKKLIAKQKLDELRVASGKQWQERFGVPEQIPVTLVLDRGKVRVMHDAVMADPVSFLEADLKAIRGAAQ